MTKRAREMTNRKSHSARCKYLKSSGLQVVEAQEAHCSLLHLSLSPATTCFIPVIYTFSRSPFHPKHRIPLRLDLGDHKPSNIELDSPLNI